MGFYATTEVRDENRCSPVFRSDKSENRLIKSESLASVPDAAKVKVENLYDYMGRRVRKTVSSDYSGGSYTTTNVTTYVWDGFNIIAEMCDAGYTNWYTYGLDLSGTLQGAGGVGGLLCVVQNGEPYFPCYDGNGNICDYIDESGTVVAHREYDPFGRTIALTGSKKDDFSFWFSTHYLDAETGIYKAKFRDYSPELGRFLSYDPIGEEGFSATHQGMILVRGSDIDSVEEMFTAWRQTGSRKEIQQERLILLKKYLMFTGIDASEIAAHESELEDILKEMSLDDKYSVFMKRFASLHQSESSGMRLDNLYRYVDNDPISSIDAFGLTKLRKCKTKGWWNKRCDPVGASCDAIIFPCHYKDGTCQEFNMHMAVHCYCKGKKGAPLHPWKP